MCYRRARVSGGTFFFTLVTENRRPLFRHAQTVALLMECLDKIRKRHPFQLDGYVVLPDHLHALWTLPDGDTNFSTRWRLIKEAFTRAYIKTYALPLETRVGTQRASRASGRGDSGSMRSAMRVISRGISITFTSIPFIMDCPGPLAIGLIRVSCSGSNAARTIPCGDRMLSHSSRNGRSNTSSFCV